MADGKIGEKRAGPVVPLRFDIRRFAAVDMFGTRGTTRRRRIVLAEFVIGCLGSLAFGAFLIAKGDVTNRLIGLWLIGIGANYGPLSLQAIRLSKPGELEREVAGITDLIAELRWYGVVQLILLIPATLPVIATLAWGRGRRRSSSSPSECRTRGPTLTI